LFLSCVCVCRGVVLCRCVCVCDLLIFLQHPSLHRRDYSLDYLREAFTASPFTAPLSYSQARLLVGPPTRGIHSETFHSGPIHSTPLFTAPLSYSQARLLAGPPTRGIHSEPIHSGPIHSTPLFTAPLSYSQARLLAGPPARGGGGAGGHGRRYDAVGGTAHPRHFASPHAEPLRARTQRSNQYRRGGRGEVAGQANQYRRGGRKAEGRDGVCACAGGGGGDTGGGLRRRLRRLPFGRPPQRPRCVRPPLDDDDMLGLRVNPISDPYIVNADRTPPFGRPLSDHGACAPPR